MASRPTVQAQDVLRAIHELHRRGTAYVIDMLDEHEPALTDHLTEALSLVHREVLNLGGPARASQRVYWRVEELTLVCVLALRGRDGDAERRDDEEPADDGP
ncbi:MAG: hypothetical protein WD009_09960 [Phycisphaeraceae bacterium]